MMAKFYTRNSTYSRTWLLGKPGEELKELLVQRKQTVDRAHLARARAHTQGWNPGVRCAALPAVPPSRRD